MAEEEVGLRLALKDRHQTVAGLDDVGDKLDRVGDEADQAGRKARIAAGGLLTFGRSGKLAGRAVVYGMGAAAAGVVGAGIVLSKLAKDSIGEAREAQKVGAITRQEIKATGGVANVTSRSMSRLSGAISEKVGIDDEAIQSGGNLLLTFKNVRNEVGKGNKVFDRATAAAVDLSAAGFGSIESESKMLGKALNDPLKGITALSRAGVTFSDGQKAQIEQFVEQNDLLAAQKLILGEVESQVGGVAAAQATWGDKAEVSIGNIKEGIGTALLPLLDRTEKWFVQKGAPVLEDWVGIFEKRGIPTIERYAGLFADKAVPAIGDFLDEARPLAKSVLPAIGTGLSTAADAFKVIAPRAKQVFDAFNDLPDWAKTGIALGALGGVAAKKLGAFDKGSLLGSIATTAKPLPVYVVNNGIGGVGAGGKPGATPIAGGKPAVPGIPGGFLGALGLTAGVTLASTGEHAGDRANAHLMPQMDWDTYLKQRKDAQIKAARETAAALDQLLVKPLGRVKDLNTQFDFLGIQRPTPKITTPGMDAAIDSGDKLIGILGLLDRTVAAPRIVIDGVEAARTAIANVGSALSGLIGSFGGGGSSSGGGGGGRHDWNDLKAPRAPKHDDRSPAGRAMTPSSFDDYFGDLPPLERAPITVQSILDGRVIAESTVRHLDDRLASR